MSKLKEKLQRKIEKNTIKSELSWIDKEGVSHTEEVILKRSKFPIIGDWGRIYPPLNEDGSWNLINFFFGGRKNLIRLLIILGIVLMVFYGIYDLLQQCQVIANNLCVKSCLNPLI